MKDISQLQAQPGRYKARWHSATEGIVDYFAFNRETAQRLGWRTPKDQRGS